jgi:hypothetical protein
MIYNTLGDAIVTEDEYVEAVTSGELTEFYKQIGPGGGRSPGAAASSRKKAFTVTFSTGSLTVDNAIQYRDVNVKSGSRIPFEPIGIGKPLTIMLRELYTGRHPEQGFLWRSPKPVLVTSAVRKYSASEAQPHALNVLTKIKNKHRRLSGPGAAEKGTSLIYYSPAVTSDWKRVLLDVYMSVEDFDDRLFQSIGNACQAASSIPLFLPHSTCLLTAGAITKLAGTAGKKIFDDNPEFRGHDTGGLNIGLAGEEPTPAGFRLVTDEDLDELDRDFRTKYHLDPMTGHVVDASGAPYAGEIPYAVISLDGAPDEQLRSFAPTAASAELLARFFRAEENASYPFDTLTEAMTLYNDFVYRTKVDELDAEIARIRDNPGLKETKQSERDAHAANIVNDLMKKKTKKR